MPVLPAGSTVTVTLGEYDSVTVECPGGASCTVESPVGTKIAEVGGGSRTFGPYGAGTAVKLTASGRDVQYQTQDGADGGALTEVGNITAAELLTTTGTLGQTVRLSDGPDRGAILMWATPQGATTPTWCWWLWPQAAY